jgi:hypothetical protein
MLVYFAQRKAGLLMKSAIRFSSFPRTSPPPRFITEVVDVFRSNEDRISTVRLAKGLTSDRVLADLRDDLIGIGFEVESGKAKSDKIERPVFYGENGVPALRYQVDGYHTDWRCGLEIEAGRAWMGNAVYRDLIQAMVMVEVDHLCLAIPNTYKYKSGGRDMESKDYSNTVAVADAVFGHTRIQIPYGLTVIGY